MGVVSEGTLLPRETARELVFHSPILEPNLSKSSRLGVVLVLTMLWKNFILGPSAAKGIRSLGLRMLTMVPSLCCYSRSMFFLGKELSLAPQGFLMSTKWLGVRAFGEREFLSLLPGVTIVGFLNSFYPSLA